MLTDHLHSRLEPVLLQMQLLPKNQLRETVARARKFKQSLLVYVLQHFPVNALTMSQACARYFNLPHLELTDFPREKLPSALINDQLIQYHPVLPIIQEPQRVQVAISDPDDFPLLDDIQYQTGLHTQAIMVPYDQLTQLINQLLSAKNYSKIAEKSEQFDENSPTVAFVEQILTDAIYRQASDIHCEPLADYYRIRMRIDGLLHEITHTPAHLANSITSRLKILAQCDISERRLPQDGRFTFTAINGQSRDCRLSTCPTLHGEKIVVRLLDSNQNILSIEELGLSTRAEQTLRQALSQPQGLILVTGPTGSGKTVTLYTALQYLNKKIHNISTVEEPVEIQLPGINQVNVNEKTGLTFSNVLRAFLRQDPDIIMVGEIRDKETAEIAIRAAQTGHLVLSTLHTNSAPDTVIRLFNMGIAPFNLASSLRLIIAQRLIRKLCQHCQPETAHTCPYCMEGYHGREGIFEVMPISQAISALILQGNKHEIAAQAKLEGMQSLWEAALVKVKQGMTSMTEIYRVVEQDG